MRTGDQVEMQVLHSDAFVIAETREHWSNYLIGKFV